MWILAAALLTLGFVFLAREAEATEFVRKEIRRRAVIGRTYHAVEEDGVCEVDGRKHRIARFLDAMLDCSPCVSAYASMPALATVWIIGQVNEIAAGFIILLVAGPVGSIGLLYAFTLLSPTQAMSAALAGLAKFKSKNGGPGAANQDPQGR